MRQPRTLGERSLRDGGTAVPATLMIRPRGGAGICTSAIQAMSAAVEQLAEREWIQPQDSDHPNARGSQWLHQQQEPVGGSVLVVGGHVNGKRGTLLCDTAAERVMVRKRDLTKSQLANAEPVDAELRGVAGTSRQDNMMVQIHVKIGHDASAGVVVKALIVDDIPFEVDVVLDLITVFTLTTGIDSSNIEAYQVITRSTEGIRKVVKILSEVEEGKTLVHLRRRHMVVAHIGQDVSGGDGVEPAF